MIEKAKRYARIIGNLPFVEQVSLTGSLAEGRQHQGSDIDFFVQVHPGRIYFTRLLVTLVVQLLGVRRHDQAIAGRICLNWFATFDGPARQGRAHQVLWQRTSSELTFIERLLSGSLGQFLEQLAKKFQQARFARDPRTHELGSLVRFSDEELGFHPPKQ
ncbi:nucleotidyltransferase domain-containing protein [Candidatus Berkelbacteria bacterium]|nr:nucleotidyltransferase domain-containing protein [Candidatus Berkelbacteria bacterium]